MKSSSNTISYNDFFEKCQDKRRNLSHWGAQDMREIFDSYTEDKKFLIDQSMRTGLSSLCKKHIHNAYYDYNEVRKYTSLNDFMTVLLHGYSDYSNLRMQEAIAGERIQEVVDYMQTYPINVAAEARALGNFQKSAKQENIKLGFKDTEVALLCNASRDMQGNNFLHLAAPKMSAVQLRNFIKQIPEAKREGMILQRNNAGKSVIDLVRYDFDKVKGIQSYAKGDIYPSRLPAEGGSPSVEDVFRICDEIRGESKQWDWGHKATREYDRWKPKIMHDIMELYTEAEKFSIFKSMRESPKKSNIRVVFDHHVHKARETYNDIKKYRDYDSFIKGISHGYNNHCAARDAQEKAKSNAQSNQEAEKDKVIVSDVSKKLPAAIIEEIQQQKIERDIKQQRIAEAKIAEDIKQQKIEKYYNDLTANLSEAEKVRVINSDMELRITAINKLLISNNMSMGKLQINKEEVVAEKAGKSNRNYQDAENSRRNNTAKVAKEK